MRTSEATLVGTLWRAEGADRVLRAVLVAVVGSALLWASAKVQIPWWPVPMTMQTFAVLVIGMACGWRLGAATVLLYLAEGAAGLPVFAKGGGFAYFAGPTGGYLVGFALAAGLVGWLAERGWDRSVVRTLAAMLAGTLVIYGGGLAWLTPFLAGAKGIALTAAFPAAVAAGVTPFLTAAAFKVALAAAVLPLAWKAIERRR